jgi:hypothetical protein
VFVREGTLVLATQTFSVLLHPVRKFIIFAISYHSIVGLSFAARDDYLSDNVYEKYPISPHPISNIKTCVQVCICNSITLYDVLLSYIL